MKPSAVGKRRVLIWSAPFILTDSGTVEMLNTFRAVVRDGKIELLEEVEIPEGMDVLVTPLVEEQSFWLNASEGPINSVWGNAADDIYAELLER